MPKFFYLTLAPLLAAALYAQADPSSPTAVEQADREFLSKLEQKAAAVTAPTPPPVATGPAPTTVARPEATRSEPTSRITAAKPKPKAPTASDRSRSTKERPAQRARVSDEPIYRGIPVIDPPAVVARVERKLRPIFRSVEIRRPVVRVTTTTVTTRAERDEDEDEDDD